ncbi:MAG TPA: hypothetical protein VGS19_23885 [Streptosporangiaceae bacterium]|nr:hypothetical protein [Streptosporangiaceae bacterium]
MTENDGQGHLVPPAWLEANGLTAEELERFKADFERANRTGRVKILTPLPRRVRARLWLRARVTGVGVWLMDHGRYGLAEALWRVCRMLP